MVKYPLAMQDMLETGVLFLDRKDPLEKEINGNPPQYSCLENPMNRGAWQATVHRGHTESDTTKVI